MTQFFCQHPEYGYGGWGHPWPDEDPYPHACCIICCPHSSMEQRIAYGRSAECRWIFLLDRPLDSAPEWLTLTLAPEDIPRPMQPDVSEMVVLSDGNNAHLYSVTDIDGDTVTFHSEWAYAKRLQQLRLADRDERIKRADERRRKSDD